MKPQTLEQTIVEVLSKTPQPNAALKAIRKLHPKVSKKQIIRAAFGAMIDKSTDEIDTSRTLQNFALTTSTTED